MSAAPMKRIVAASLNANDDRKYCVLTNASTNLKTARSRGPLLLVSRLLIPPPTILSVRICD
jgi:hypothetical protein